MGDAGLVFDVLDMLGVSPDGDYRLVTKGAPSGTDWGNYEPITSAMEAFLQAGATVAHTGDDNRTMPIAVRVMAETAAGLAHAEQDLMLVCRKTGNGNWVEGKWTPPGKAGESPPASVFDVVFARLERASWDDFGEVAAGELWRDWKVTWTALPWAHEETPTTLHVDAPPATPASAVTVDDCSTTTYWTAEAAPPITPIVPVGGGGHVSAIASIPGSTFDAVTLTLTPADPVVFGNRHFVRVEVGWATFRWTPSRIELIAVDSAPGGGSAWMAPVAQSGSVYWFDVDAVGDRFDKLRVHLAGSATHPGQGADITLSVYDVSIVDSTTSAGDTNRMLYRTVNVKGSVPAPATLALDGGDSGLGLTVVHTTPAEPGMIQPPLRSLLNLGLPSGTADADTLSGTVSDLSTLHQFNVPINGIPPRRAYQLWALVRVSAAANRTLSWSAKSNMLITEYDDGLDGSLTVTLGTDWQWVCVADMTLPPRPLGSLGFVAIDLQADAATDLDEACLFDVERGRLTVVDCGAKKRLWLDAARLGWPTPAVYVGNEADRSDQVHAGGEGLQALGVHEFAPSAENVWTATKISTTTALDLSYKRHVHTHLYDEPDTEPAA